jgi:hypothetical protein
MHDSPRCGWWWFLLWSTVGNGITLQGTVLLDIALLGIADEAFDELHVFCDNILINTLRLETTEERKPGWVDARRREALFGIITHVSDMDE